MYKVVVISSFHEQGLALLRRDDIELHVVDDFSHESLSRALKDADAVTVRTIPRKASSSRPDKSSLRAASSRRICSSTCWYAAVSSRKPYARSLASQMAPLSRLEEKLSLKKTTSGATSTEVSPP